MKKRFIIPLIIIFSVILSICVSAQPSQADTPLENSEFYFNFFFLRMWIILETATSSSISIPTCQYSLLFYSIILALSIILGLKWTKKFDFQLKNIFTTSY